MIQLEGVHVCAQDVRDDRDAVDVIAQAHYEHHAHWVVLPVEHLPAEFFVLRTGRAGAIAQKFVDYRMNLAVVGDIEAHLAASTSFRDWVLETNRGRHLWFVPDLETFAARLRD
jgi:hypothetical protein